MVNVVKLSRHAGEPLTIDEQTRAQKVASALIEPVESPDYQLIASLRYRLGSWVAQEFSACAEQDSAKAEATFALPSEQGLLVAEV